MTTNEKVAKIREWWFDVSLSRADMARRLGVSTGYLQRLAKGAGLPDRRGAAFRPRMQVMIRGELFPDVQAVAERFGLNEDGIRRAIWEGRADGIGLGMGRYVRTQPSPGRRPLRIGPFTWNSRKDAAQALGISYTRLCQLRKTGRNDILNARAMAIAARQTKQAMKAAAGEAA